MTLATGVDRPIGRYAKPGDLEGPPNPPWLNCRRCGAPCSRDGHPHGCPRTPEYRIVVELALRPCYCGRSIILAPDWLGACCADMPPVRVPGGCDWCGSEVCQVCDPDDEPRISGRGGWAHARCLPGRGVS